MLAIALIEKPILSSHITTDLEKVADYITFIHNGKLIMTATKNDLVYNFAVMRCKESQFLELDPSDVIAYRKRDFQTDATGRRQPLTSLSYPWNSA